MPIASILRYFRACYAADYKAVQLLNFFSKKITHPLLLPEANLLDGSLMQVPVDSAWGQTVTAYLLLHSKEKQLVSGSLFLLGKTTLLGKAQRICAPLYLHNVEILHEDEVYYLSINENDPIINPTVIDSLKNASHNNGLYEELVDQLPKGYLGFDQMHKIQTLFAKYFPELDIKTLDDYPQLHTRNQLRAPQNGYKLVPAIGVGLMDKSSGSMGVLNELEEIADAEKFSGPLQELFGQRQTPIRGKKKTAIWLPVSLSANQQRILQDTPGHRLNMVVGPPGTGKSFTIAALAVNCMSRGESVLIASKNTQAVNVVANKIEAEMGLHDTVVRASGRDYKKFLRRRLQDWLNGIGLKPQSSFSLLETQLEISRLERKVKKMEKIATRRELHEIQHGEKFLQEGGWWHRWQLQWLQHRLKRKVPMWEYLFDLEQKLQRLHAEIRNYLYMDFQHRLIKTLRFYRGDLMQFLKGLKSKTGNEKGSYFANVRFSKVLQALPVWVVNAADVHRVLPLEKELFDVVLIDEASQCDIASALPLVQRAKRVVVVGDPKQLRHISFLSHAQQEQLARQLGLQAVPADWLNYRSKSLLDLVSDVLESQDQIHFLDEHFRSQPSIIAFSNAQFYRNQLKIMTATPINQLRNSVYLHPTEGNRSAQGHNSAEVARVLEKVEEIINQEAPLYETLCQSIGILSPFRDQVNQLRKQAQERFSEAQLSRHQLLIGTPFEFQGEERDIMLLSFAVDNETPGGVFHYLNRADVFNVSITRARAKQLLYHSFDPKNLDRKSLLRQYFDHLASRITPPSSQEKTLPRDPFLQEIYELLQRWKMEKVYVHYPIAGMNIDLVVVNQGRTFCIDLVGYPGQFAEAIPIERWRILDRIGLKSFALPYSLWCFEKERCAGSLSHFLEQN